MNPMQQQEENDQHSSSSSAAEESSDLEDDNLTLNDLTKFNYQFNCNLKNIGKWDMLKTKCIKALTSKSFENQNSMFVDESSLPLSDVATRKFFTSSILYSL